MADRQTELDEVVDRLREFEAGDTVTLVTGAGSLTGRVVDARWRDGGATVTLVDSENDRRVRVSTEWYGGWLDPLVDAYPATPDADAADTDTDHPDPDLGRPLGTLVDARVANVAARKGRHGRP